MQNKKILLFVFSLITACVLEPGTFNVDSPRAAYEKALSPASGELLDSLEQFLAIYPSFEPGLNLYVEECLRKEKIHRGTLFITNLRAHFPEEPLLPAVLGMLGPGEKISPLELYKQSLELGSSFTAYRGILETHKKEPNHVAEKMLSLNIEEIESVDKAMALGCYFAGIQDFTNSLEYWEKALSFSPGEEGRLLILMNLGALFLDMGQYAEVSKKLDEALLLARKIGAVYEESLIYGHFGELCYALKDFHKALEYYNLELARILAGKADGELGYLYFRLGVVYNEMEDFEEAYDYYLKAKELTTPGKDNLLLLKINNSLGVLHMDMKNFTMAEEYLSRALEYAGEINDKIGLCIIHINLIQINITEEKYERALSYTNQAYPLALELDVPMIQIYLLHHLSEIYLGKQEYKKAAVYAAEGEALAERTGVGEFVDRFLLLQASISTYDGEWEEAGVFLTSLTESAGEKGTDEMKVKILFGWGRLYFAESNYRKAIDYCYMAIDKLNDLCARSTSLENKVLLYSYYKDVYDLTIRTLVKLYENLGEEDYYIKALEICEEARSLFLKENLRVYGISGDSVFLPDQKRVKGKSLITERIRETGQVILEYFPLGDHIYLWVITGDSIKFYDTPFSFEKNGTDLRAWKHNLLSGNPIENLGKKMYNLLLKEALADVEEGRTLCIIPYGELYGLAFEALQGEDDNYLIEKFPLFYSPSLEVLFFLNQREAARPGRWTKDLLTLGAPQLDSPAFPEIPGSGKEAREIGRLFEKVDVRTGEEASESLIKTPGFLNEFRFIHIASHSIVDRLNRWNSGILLSRGNAGGEDGLLDVKEISQLSCSSEMIVLSACHTASGEIIEGDGFSGFSYTWFVAGGTSLLLSLRSVEDQFTSRFMIKFYSLLKKGGLSKAEALREAKIHFIRSGGNPGFWCSFILTGSV